EEAVIDVRKPGEYSSAHIANVPNLPLDFINDHVADFPSQKTTYLHCAGGYRSMIAASILKARGFHNMIDVIGGVGQIKNTSLPIVTQECENSCSTKENKNASDFRGVFVYLIIIFSVLLPLSVCITNKY